MVLITIVRKKWGGIIFGFMASQLHIGDCYVGSALERLVYDGIERWLLGTTLVGFGDCSGVGFKKKMACA